MARNRGLNALEVSAAIREARAVRTGVPATRRPGEGGLLPAFIATLRVPGSLPQVVRWVSAAGHPPPHPLLVELLGPAAGSCPELTVLTGWLDLADRRAERLPQELAGATLALLHVTGAPPRTTAHLPCRPCRPLLAWLGVTVDTTVPPDA
ncbi:hypothetical protein AB0D08_19140 [Kitasatospora sp. NPDC048540]|uniref:hypothetical protein n=1 Tax=unclassified Kitasatospora TaxID=2633591 RepID=UPI000539F683|nr:hypothetical protein [Kitasatospora sp. MBT63]